MIARRALRMLAAVAMPPVGVAVAFGLLDALRNLPGPKLALALPLRETGQADAASLIAIVLVSATVFALAAHLVRPSPRLWLASAGWQACWVFAWSLGVQALSLQLVRQAAFGFDWRAALATPTPWVFATAAVLTTIAAAKLSSYRLSVRRLRAATASGGSALARGRAMMR